MRRLVPATLLIFAITALVGAARQGPMQEWPVYGGDPGGLKASPLADINQSNVERLAVAWEWRPEDQPLEEYGTRPGNFQNTPLMIDNVPQFGRSNPSAAKRFILLVDTLYDRGIKLAASFAVPLAELAGESRNAGEFQRTQSRLVEMQSTGYLEAAHKPVITPPKA